MKLTGSNVTIMVKDMNKSISFYESIGLKLQQRWDDNYAMMEGPGITLGIHPGADEESGSGDLSIGFFVDSFEEAKDLLKKNNITITHEADDGKSGNFLHFNDPDGIALYFMEPKWDGKK
jgi:catechol 2,3-dioxygenase-like lactoylglutathione lyase family enzyme